MKENYISKMKTLLVAIIMLASVIFVIQMAEVTEAATSDMGLSGAITNICFNGEPSGAIVSGVVNISWTSTASFESGDEMYYNLTFGRHPDTQTTGGGIWGTPHSGNQSAGGATNTYFLWNTTEGKFPDGEWWVNVTGGFYNATHEDRVWLNSTTRKVIVSNTMRGTPGVDVWEGGRYWLWNSSKEEQFRYYWDEVITVSDGELKYGDTPDITLNSTLTWGTKDYWLYKPLYNGSKSGEPYNLSWQRYSLQPNEYFTTGGSQDGYKINDITLDRAGLWVITEYPTSIGTAWVDSKAFSSIEEYNNSIWAWFWVNTSTDYTIDLTGISSDEFTYNSSGSMDMEIFEGTDTVPLVCVDFTNETNELSIKAEGVEYTATGIETWYFNKSYFNSVNNFTGRAYKDLDYISDDDGIQYYKEYSMDNIDADGWAHYNETYGSNAYKNGSASWLSAASRYNWSMCGPWDPPEQNATVRPVQVKTGTPYTAISENATVYYGFDGTVNITLLESSTGDAISQGDIQVYILDDDNINVTANFSIYESTSGDGAGSARTTSGSGLNKPGRITIKKPGANAGWILINMTRWGRNNSHSGGGDDMNIGDNGTWEVHIWVDTGSDREINGGNAEWAEEWNTSINFRVKSAPKAQFKWVDDDGAVWSDADTDEIIPYIPSATNVPLDIQFKVYDSGGNTFGDITSGQASGKCELVTQCAENITISGNSLFTGALSSFPGFHENWYSGGIWTVPIIPTMSIGGGSIEIKVNAYNSSVLKTITIGGENYDLNGSVVSVEPNNFEIDTENKTLSVTVQFADDGTDMRTANVVHLYYLDDTYTGSIDSDINGPITAHSVANTTIYSGGYTIPFNTTQQTENQTDGLNDLGGAGFAAIQAPRNLTIYVDGPGNRDGYALIQMKPVSDLEVHISQDVFMAGYEYDDVTISCDFVGENNTNTPSTKTTEKDNFHVKIYDEWHNDVTGTNNNDNLLYGIYASKLTGSDAYVFDDGGNGFDGVYGIEAGTYTIYAYNNTHNSEGHNATFEIRPVEVTCDMAPFIWTADTNISATFEIMYDGEHVDGTLVIDNMTDQGSYNRTWTNCSFDGSTDTAGNSSLEVSSSDITDGVVTVNDITADKLHPDKEKQYITFWFKPLQPDGSDSPAFARAKQRIEVRVPNVIPDPQYIPLGRTTKVYCTATGRSDTDLLNDVYVRLHGQGFDQNSTTDVDGRVTFSITPSSTGNISIDVGEKNRTLADTVVYVVSWVIDGSTDAEVNELDEFTVTVIKEGTSEVVVGAAVSIIGIGEGTTDANGQVTFTAPEVTSDRLYTIKITKEGYAPDPDGVSITVINIPKLILVLPEEKDGKHAAATTKFEIAVADDTGTAIVGAIISFDGKTYTTGVGGTAKITAPKKKGSYPIEVTFGNYEKFTTTVEIGKAPGVPGFELLTLIAAIGIAFILFRRRKH